MAAPLNRPMREPRADRARQLRAELLAQLAPDGRCAICGAKPRLAELTIDHVDGCTYRRHALSAWGRVARYWDEYRGGIRLRALCGPCNSRDGQRFRARPATRHAEVYA